MSDLGTIEPIADGLFELRLERRYPQPLEEVWDALTRPERMANWYAECTYEPVAGSPITQDFGESGVSHGVVQVFDPPHCFEFTSIDGVEKAETVVRFELSRDGDETLVVLTQTRQTLWSVERTAPGWHACFELFAAELRGEQLEWDPVWERVKPLYVKRTRALAQSGS